MRRVHVSVDLSRRGRSRRPASPQPGLHPVHVGDDGHAQGRRALPRGDRRPRRGLRSGAAVQRRGPRPLGAATGLSFRGHDRRLRAGRRAHPAVSRHLPGEYRRVDPATGRERLLRVPAALRAHEQPRADGSARQPAAGTVHQRADRSGRHGALRIDVRCSGRPSLRDHRGRAAVHQSRNRWSAGRRGRSRRTGIRGRRVLGGGPPPAVRDAGRGRRAGRRPLLRVLCAVGAARAHVPGRLVPHGRHRLARRGRRSLSPGPQEGRHLRGGSQVLPRRGRGVHQRVPGSQGVARVRDPARSPGSGASGRGGPRHTRSGPRRAQSALRAGVVAVQGSAGVHGRRRILPPGEDP
jgi:hypothetical protein